MDESAAIERAWDLRSSDPPEAIRLAEPLCVHPSPAVRARARAAVGHATLRCAGPEAAADVLGDALAVEGLLGTERGRLLVVWGAVHMARGSLLDALRCYQEGADLLREAGSEEDAAGSLINIAAVHRHLGDTPRAQELFVESAARFRALGSTYGEAVALIGNAQIFFDLGDAASAAPLAERAWQLAKPVERPGFLAFVQANLGRVLAASGEQERGTALLEEAVTLAEQTGVPQAISEALGHLGVVLREVDPGRAREILARGVALVREHGDNRTLCVGLLDLGDAGPPEAAYARYAEAAALVGEGTDSVALRAHRSAARSAPDTETEARHWRAYADASEGAADQERSRRLVRVQAAALLDEIRSRDAAARARIAHLSSSARRDSDLLAVAVHDIRGPLQVAIGHADLLEMDGARTAHLMRALERIDQILRLIDSEVSQQRAPAEPEELLPLVRAIVEEHRLAASRKQQRIVLEGASVVALITADRLFHVVDNLVSNAVKFSPVGGTITTRIRQVGPWARIEVEDQGPGVPRAEVDKLFERAAKGSARPTGGERSRGLGLYIARRMVEQLNGRIGVAPGAVGACFWVQLPLP